jgi:hypothetical protein
MRLPIAAIRCLAVLFVLGCGTQLSGGDPGGADGGQANGGQANGGQADGGQADGGHADGDPVNGSEPDAAISGGADGGAVLSETLETATGCDGPFNPNQVLVFRISMAAADWTALKADSTASIYYPATFACGEETPIAVAVRRRRSGAGDKFGIKIDINRSVLGQRWRGLTKLQLDVGAGSFAASGMSALVGEYMCWRMHRLGGHHASRSALAHLYVNENDQGVYSNIEEVDKRFLESRLGDDSGWLYKISGQGNDGYRTNETTLNPYEAQWCIFDNSPCALPADFQTWLPEHLAIEQLMRLGAVNVIVANEDGPIQKANNLYWYDYAAGPRYYFPWDLDSCFNSVSGDIFPEPNRISPFHTVLFTHWEDDYDALLTAMVDGPLSVASVHAEMDRVVTIAGPTIDADPIIGGGAAGIIAGLKSWYESRHAEVTQALAAH